MKHAVYTYPIPSCNPFMPADPPLLIGVFDDEQLAEKTVRRYEALGQIVWCVPVDETPIDWEKLMHNLLIDVLPIAIVATLVFMVVNKMYIQQDGWLHRVVHFITYGP